MVKKIVLAKIYFTDFKDYKIRPIFIVKAYKDEDFLYLPLTTNIKLEGILIKNTDLDQGYLKEDSIVVVPKIGILHKDFIEKEIATLKISTFKKILKAICKNFGCDKN